MWVGWRRLSTESAGVGEKRRLVIGLMMSLLVLCVSIMLQLFWVNPQSWVCYLRLQIIMLTDACSPWAACLNLCYSTMSTTPGNHGNLFYSPVKNQTLWHIVYSESEHLSYKVSASVWLWFACVMSLYQCDFTDLWPLASLVEQREVSQWRHRLMSCINVILLISGHWLH